MAGIGIVSRNLVPLSSYTKPLMKLSKHDKSLIWQWEKFAFKSNQEIADYERELSLPGLTKYQKAEIKQKISTLIENIKSAQETIRSIKEQSYAALLSSLK